MNMILCLQYACLNIKTKNLLPKDDILKMWLYDRISNCSLCVWLEISSLQLVAFITTTITTTATTTTTTTANDNNNIHNNNNDNNNSNNKNATTKSKYFCFHNTFTTMYINKMLR